MSMAFRTSAKAGLIVCAMLGSALSVLSQAPYAIRRYVLPTANWEGGRFAVLDKGVVAMPLAGGLYLPGADRWLLPPDSAYRVEGVACAHADTSLFLTATGSGRCRVIRIGVGHSDDEPRTITDLPTGRHDVHVNARGDSLLIVTEKPDGLEVSLHAHESTQPMGRIQDLQVRCYHVIDMRHILLYAEGGVFLWTFGEELRLLFHTHQQVLSMAVAANGNILLGMPSALFEMDNTKTLRKIAEVRPGELRVWNGLIYALCPETSELLELSRRD